MSESDRTRWDDLSDAEKKFILNQIEEKKAEYQKALHATWNGWRCTDCKEKFDDTQLNTQSSRTPGLCVVCDEYRSKQF